VSHCYKDFIRLRKKAFKTFVTDEAELSAIAPAALAAAKEAACLALHVGLAFVQSGHAIR
jgi:hypothetical protein